MKHENAGVVPKYFEKHPQHNPRHGACVHTTLLSRTLPLSNFKE